jgi:hypothetical protein
MHGEGSHMKKRNANQSSERASPSTRVLLLGKHFQVQTRVESSNHDAGHELPVEALSR